MHWHDTGCYCLLQEAGIPGVDRCLPDPSYNPQDFSFLSQWQMPAGDALGMQCRSAHHWSSWVLMVHDTILVEITSPGRKLERLWDWGLCFFVGAVSTTGGLPARPQGGLAGHLDRNICQADINPAFLLSPELACFIPRMHLLVGQGERKYGDHSVFTVP